MCKPCREKYSYFIWRFNNPEILEPITYDAKKDLNYCLPHCENQFTDGRNIIRSCLMDFSFKLYSGSWSTNAMLEIYRKVREEMRELGLHNQ